MSVSGQVSVTSSIGTQLVFTVTGTNTLGYAKTFQNILFNAGAVTEHDLSAGTTGSETLNGGASGYALDLNLVTVPGTVTLPSNEPGAITFVDQNGAVTVNGSGAGDYVLFTGINPSATYIDNGNGNTVIFTEGNNLYQGDAANNTGNHDYVIAGQGFDTINTGSNGTDVYSGTGHAKITLNDTASFNQLAPVFSDFAYLNDGNNTVYASGNADAIVATAPGQSIVGGANTAGVDIVTLLPSPTAGAPGNDTIVGGQASIAVFDSVGGNQIFGGGGATYFVGGANVTDTITGSSGPLYAFGGSGDSVTFAGTTAPQTISGFVAGVGNETLNAAGFGGTLEVFGNNTADSAAAATSNESLVGGTGLNAFLTGDGNETITAGTTGNIIYLNAAADGVSNTGTILINDFGATANNAVTAVGFTDPNELANDIAAGTVGGTQSDPSFTIKLSDGTTVTFMGVSSLSGHTF